MTTCHDNCDNSCEALNGLYEKAVNLIAYSELIKSWVNGPKTGTVNIAGTNTPTLLNIATTLKTNSDNLIATLQSRINNIPNSIIQSGGGIRIDGNGKLYINFDDMPIDKFEALLKSLRVPIWLNGNTNFYVNKSHASASDTLDSGRGLSESKPFKNLQPCVNYITDNYNVGNYSAIINIAAGDYRTDSAAMARLALPAFSRGTGRIILRGPQLTTPSVICDCIDGYGYYRLENIRSAPRFGNPNSVLLFPAINGYQGLNLELLNYHADFSGLNSDNFERLGFIYAENGATINTVAYTMESIVGSFFKANTNIQRILFVQSSAQVIFQADLNIIGNISTDATVYCRSAATVSFDASGYPNPGRYGQVNLTGTVTGKRYQVETNGIINTRSGGPSFLPGSLAGTTASGGQYT